MLVHAEISIAMLDKHVEFLETAMVEQQFNALSGSELAALVLGIDAGLATAKAGLRTAVVEAFENVFHGMFHFRKGTDDPCLTMQRCQVKSDC